MSDAAIATVLMIGTFDSKGKEYSFLRQCLIERGCQVVAVNVGTLGTTDLFPVDIEATAIAHAAGADLQDLVESRDRGRAIQVMSLGAAQLVRDLYEQRPFSAVIGMGGSGGTGIVTAAMRALPRGIPKVCISTLAASNVSSFVGLSDIVMVPSIVDVSGLNGLLCGVLARAAGAVAGMISAAETPAPNSRPMIGASMFGNTTTCVDLCRKQLEESGFEVLVFHATGTGGRLLESLVEEGWLSGVLDITTTEWADELCGGVLSAGPDRLDAPGRRGIPHLIVPGCIDMCNFGSLASVPEKYRTGDRQFYEWSPEVTLMRTNVEENRRLGEIFARKANAATGPVSFLIPLRGYSMLDGDGERFCNRDADRAFVNALKEHLDSRIPVEEIDAAINSPEFAAAAVLQMMQLLQQ